MRWPIYTGNYLFGDKENPICINCLGSKIDIPNKYFSILGSCMTENLGIEKIVANVVTNPNIRYVISCGEEVQGHKPGKSFLALYNNGIDDSKKIIDAPGAIPYVENLNHEIVREFQKQVQVIDMIGEVDPKKIIEKAKELLARDNKKYESNIDLEKYFRQDEKKEDDEFISTTDILLSLSKIEQKLEDAAKIESSQISFFPFLGLFSLFLLILTLLVIL